MPDFLISGAGLKGGGQLFDALLGHQSPHKPASPVFLFA